MRRTLCVTWCWRWYRKASDARSTPEPPGSRTSASTAGAPRWASGIGHGRRDGRGEQHETAGASSLRPATHDKLAEFVTRFYRDIAQDDRFHHWFETIAHVDWHAHTAELTDFWAGMLLDLPHRHADEVIEAHRWLHDTDPFDEALFERWLEIFDATLDEGWSGPMTDVARRRGHGMAWAMAKRLIGHSIQREPQR